MKPETKTRNITDNKTLLANQDDYGFQNGLKLSRKLTKGGYPSPFIQIRSCVSLASKLTKRKLISPILVRRRLGSKEALGASECAGFRWTQTQK